MPPRKSDAADARYRFGVADLVLMDGAALGQNAPARAARICVLGAIGKLINFLDKLIASQRVAQSGITLERAISGQDDLNEYLQDYMAAQIGKVASDLSLSNPKKISCFTGIADLVKDVALAYFALRRTLEHHQDIPKNDLVLPLMHEPEACLRDHISDSEHHRAGNLSVACRASESSWI